MMQTAETRQRIGLLGGTFDPVHNGHLAAADHVRHILDLDGVWLIPAAQPPHKAGHADGRLVSSFAHRLHMLNLAVKGKKFLFVSDIEAKRDTPSYSIDTIKIILERSDGHAELYFIIGADAFSEINTWKRYKELPTLASFVVLSRPIYPPDKIGEVIRRNFPGYECDPAGNIWTFPDNRGCFIVSHMKPIPVSSTEVREKIKRGETIAGLVPPAVEAYIRRQCLYCQ